MTQKHHVDWHLIVLSPEGFNRLAKLASARFSAVEDAEEATTFVIDKISENNWRKLSGFSGNSKPETYVYSVFVNLLEEFSRKRFGRIRPPEWIKRESGIWLQVWKKICLERQPIPAVIDEFCAKEKRAPDFVSAIIKTIKSRLPWCGVKYRTKPVAHQDEYQEETELITGNEALEGDVDRQELENSLFLLSELFENLIGPSNSVSKEINTRETTDTVLMIRERMQLEEEEVLILRMAYQEGLKLNVVARALGMPSYQPGRILKRLFKNLHDELTQIGFDTADLKTLLAQVEL